MNEPNYPQGTPQQEEQYESVPVSPNELYANAMQEEKVRNIISQLNPDNQLQEIEMRIKGYRKNQYGNWEKIDESTEEPPKQLISKFISYLGSIMNQNTTLGNVSDHQVNKIMKMVIEYVTDELDSNEELYNLKNNYTEKTRIGDIVINSVFFVLTRALNGQESKKMWGSLSLTENYSMQPQKSKFSDALKFWK